MTTEVLSLRAQKRQATYAAIRTQAAKLVIERGFDAVTVEDICAAARVSKRTFFNYVDSKESAVLGPLMPLPTAEYKAAFLRTIHPSLVRAVLNFLVDPAVAVEKEEGTELMRLCREIYKTHPLLAANHVARNRAFIDEALEITTAYLEAHPAKRVFPQSSLLEEAACIAGLAWSALHVGMHQWLRENSSQHSLRETCHHALTMMLSLERPTV